CRRGFRIRAGRLLEHWYQAEIHLALTERLERLAAEVERHRGPDRVYRVSQQQHLDAARARRFKLRVCLQAFDVVADEVVDLRLVWLEISDIFVERAQAVTARRAEAGQCEQLVTPLVILVETLLENLAERLPDF